MGGGNKDEKYPELFDAARRGDADKLNAWLNNRRNRRPRTPLKYVFVLYYSSTATMRGCMIDCVDCRR